MKTIGVYELRTRLSQILREVERGEVYIVTRRGKAIARLIKADREQTPSGQGAR